MMLRRLAQELRYERVHPYQFVQAAISREIRFDAGNFSPAPLVAGHPSLLEKLHVSLRRVRTSDLLIAPLVEAAMPKDLMLSREFVESTPEQAIHKFFAHLGDLWMDFQSPTGSQALKEPDGLALAILAALSTSAYAAAVPQDSPAFAALITATEGLIMRKAANPRSHAAEVVRAFAVSHVEQGVGRVFSLAGKPATKDQLRALVLPAVQKHCGWFLPRGGVNSVEGMRDWERGHDVTPARRLALNLPAFLIDDQFSARVDGIFKTLATMLGAGLGAHLRPAE